MTNLLEQAFAAAARLPDEAQDSLAAAILEELAAEGIWQRKLAASGPALERLADEALEEFRNGKTDELDPDKP